MGRLAWESYIDLMGYGFYGEWLEGEIVENPSRLLLLQADRVRVPSNMQIDSQGINILLAGLLLLLRLLHILFVIDSYLALESMPLASPLQKQ